jgi:serine/threonine protein kinase
VDGLIKDNNQENEGITRTNNKNVIDMESSNDLTHRYRSEHDLGSEYSNSMSMISSQSLNYDKKPIDNFKHPKACVNLIQQMLDRNPKTRINIEEVLSHEWCKRNNNKTNVNIIKKGKNIIENLKKFNGSTNWWSLALYRFFVHQIVTEVDKEEIEEVFKYLDEDYGGELDRNELEKGLRKIDPTISSKIVNF